MKLIVCLDNKNGMAFNGRRQSADRVLARHMLDYIGERCLWIHPRSLSFFEELPGNVCTDPEFCAKAGPEDFCFGEDVSCLDCLSEATSIIVYRWNRTYPADLRFPASELQRRRINHTEEFKGYSHERITQEIYGL